MIFYYRKLKLTVAQQKNKSLADNLVKSNHMNPGVSSEPQKKLRVRCSECASVISSCVRYYHSAGNTKFVLI